jgi:hypothetical protein
MAIEKHLHIAYVAREVKKPDGKRDTDRVK